MIVYNFFALRDDREFRCEGRSRTAATRAILTGQHIRTFDFVTCVGVMVKFAIDTCWIKRILLVSVGRVLHPLR